MDPERRRVVVTGIGLVTPLGASAAEIRARLAGGEVAANRPAAGMPALRVATIGGFDARGCFRQPKALKLTDRKTQLAVAAAARAVADAGLADDPARDEWAIVLGCSASDLQVEELSRALGPSAPERAIEDLRFFAERVLGGLNPLWLLINLPNMVGAHVGIQLASNGPNHTLTGDWISGAQALGEAWLAIAGGEREVALAGGTEAPLDPFDLGCLAGARPPGEPPWTIAEAAAVWVLEEREHARRRGARVLGEIRGYAAGAAMAGDVPGAIRRAAAGALATAGWTPAGLAAVASACGAGHPWASAERAALAGLLPPGPGAGEPRRLDFHRGFGHALAASGPLDGALLLAELAAAPDNTPAARGLALAVGTLGQCAALALAGPAGP
jgi:3-oxoacyl-[acyl-carrier-protein] synthase II